MPGGDRTGPAGLGSKTGRGLGYCSGLDTPGFTKGPMGMSRGGIGFVGYRAYGRGRSMGCRWGQGRNTRRDAFKVPQAQRFFNPIAITPEQKVTMLKQEKEYIETEIKNLKAHSEELSKQITESTKSE